jgi:hypothetical protein
VRVLRQLAASHPDVLSLQDLTREAEELRLGLDWSPVRAEDLTRLLEDSTKRLVRSSSDLADLVHRAILEAADSLARTGQLLWNVRSKDRQDIWRPKSEVSFGTWLADQLSVRLERTGVVINREGHHAVPAAGTSLMAPPHRSRWTRNVSRYDWRHHDYSSTTVSQECRITSCIRYRP